MTKDDISKIQAFLDEQEREAERERKIVESFRKQTKPLNSELIETGVLNKNQDLWDLVEKKTPYPQAIPILLKYLHLRHKLDWSS